MEDILILGGGPAAVSAALTVRNRGRTVTILSAPLEDNPLYRAHRVNNYPGLPEVSGREMLERMRAQALAAGVTWITGRVLSAMSMAEGFGVSVGRDFYEGKRLILAMGIARARPYPGETEFLGRGVSYCATCDGMFYRDRDVAVIGLSHQAREEADFLENIGCRVRYFRGPADYVISGGDRVETLTVRGEVYPVAGVFILRSAMAPGSLMSGLPLQDCHVTVDRSMAAGIPGVYACGDCVGQPYQVAKAVGEGNIAALSACAALDAQERKQAE